MLYVEVLQKYAVFDGRAKRSEYWLYALIHSIVIAVLLLLASVIALFGVVYLLYALGTLIPSLAVSVRRLHDIGRSGWWVLLVLVPVVGAIALLIFYVIGSDEDNAYGPRPA